MRTARPRYANRAARSAALGNRCGCVGGNWNQSKASSPAIATGAAGAMPQKRAVATMAGMHPAPTKRVTRSDSVAASVTATRANVAVPAQSASTASVPAGTRRVPAEGVTRGGQMTWKRGATARGRGGGGWPRAVALGVAWGSSGDGGAGLQQPCGIGLAVEGGDVDRVGVTLLASRGGAPARQRQRRFRRGEHPCVVQVCAAQDLHDVTTLSRARTGRASTWARAFAAWASAWRNACVARLCESGCV